MGQRKLAQAKGDDLSKRPTTKRKTGNTVLDATSTRRGEAIRAQRRISENVNLQASQYAIDVPVNKSIYNGYKGEQYSPSIAKTHKSKDNQPALRIIPVGGTEIGRNTTAL